MSSSASVSFKIVPCVIDIEFDGVLSTKGVEEILIGQEFYASLNCRLVSISDTFSWTVTNGKPFADYQASINSAVLTPGSQPISSPAITCYLAEPDATSTVECVYYSAILDAAGHQANFTITRPLQTVGPDVTGLEGDTGATIYGTHLSGSPGIFPSGLLPSEPAFADTMGAIFEARITTPARFVQSPASTGKWQFVQLIENLDRCQTDDALNSYGWNFFGNLTNDLITSANTPIDTDYPYVAVIEDTSNPGIYVFEAREYGLIADGSWAVMSDKPAEFVQYYGTPPIPSKTITAADAFQTYIMYMPPSVQNRDARGVPILVWNWSWSGTATRTSISPLAYSVSGSPAGAVQETLSPAHPEWSYRFYTSALQPVTK